MKKHENEAYLARDTLPRFDFIRDWFESQKGSITEKDVQKILSGRFDGKKGLSVDFEYYCLSYTHGICVTLWSWTESIGERRLSIANKPNSGREF